MLRNTLSEEDVSLLLDKDLGRSTTAMLENGCRRIENFTPYERDKIIKILRLNNYEVGEITDWDIFYDRTKSLLERWDRFYLNKQIKPDICIKNCLEEINDDFTKSLVKKTEEFQ